MGGIIITLFSVKRHFPKLDIGPNYVYIMGLMYGNYLKQTNQINNNLKKQQSSETMVLDSSPL